MADEQIRLMIVDDHQLIRAGLRKLFEMEKDIAVVAEAESSAQALENLATSRPRIVLMDINIKGEENGLVATRKLLAADPALSVIILTVYDQHEYLVEAVKAGAVGYLLKEVDSRELITAVRRVAAGESLIDPDLGRRIMADLSQTRHRLDALSRREREILDQIAQGRANKEIADALHVSEGTIKNHLTSIFRKLGVADRTQAAILALREKQR